MLKCYCKKQKDGTKIMATVQQILKDLKFENSTQLVGFLNKHFVWKADKETEHLYILDKSNPERQRSREYEIKETKSGNLYLSEI
jgi:c-di-AMP phosphodiesterase-like protein